MALRHGPCGCGLRSRLGYVLAALVLVSCGVLAALVFPALSSDVDLDAALQSLDAFGGAGRTAHVNPNVHHPPSRQAARQPAKAVKPLSEEDDDDGNTPPGQDVAIAMISAPEPPPAAPAVVRAAPTPTRPKPIRDQAVDDEDDEDDDEDDDSSESRELGAPRRVPDAPPPPGLPPSLLPQRQPPGPAGDDPMMLGDAPQRAQRTQRAQHHKTNNGLYTNEDDLDHNILDLARQGRGQGRARQHASTRIFVEALLPSIEDQPGEPAAPQRRAWTPSSTFFRWTVSPALPSWY
ncbi:hypothetical protein ONE63_002088 [Megalurothrips usitatus]|uniref:Uncharacterized protein n=1 Tax=Megalurothrips usitatus TaxID=439358 RepID=A0AAV7XBE2_9NEOP|nr:hypothetical protein ONE63_002088 [Megalurothrips usitatus]